MIESKQLMEWPTEPLDRALEVGILIGRIQLCQRLLNQPMPPCDELMRKTREELTRLAVQLEHQLAPRTTDIQDRPGPLEARIMKWNVRPSQEVLEIVKLMDRMGSLVIRIRTSQRVLNQPITARWRLLGMKPDDLLRLTVELERQAAALIGCRLREGDEV